MPTKLNVEPNPWTTKKATTVYENNWIKVREDEVIDPNGNDTIYGVVVAKSIAVGILPLDENNNTWLVGQHRYPLNRYSWEIVEGGGSFEVSPIETGIRELKEETGIVAKEWIPLITIHTSNCIADETAYLFIARGLSFSESCPDDTEKLQVAKVPFEEAYQFVLDGIITDAMSVCAILKTKILIDNGQL